MDGFAKSGNRTTELRNPTVSDSIPVPTNVMVAHGFISWCERRISQPSTAVPRGASHALGLRTAGGRWCVRTSVGSGGVGGLVERVWNRRKGKMEPPTLRVSFLEVSAEITKWSLQRMASDCFH